MEGKVTGWWVVHCCGPVIEYGYLLSKMHNNL